MSLAYPGILFGGVQQIQLRTEDRENGDLGASYNKLFLIFVTLGLFMTTTNLFIIANIKQLRTGGNFRILLHFFRTSWGVGVLNSAIFNSVHNRVEFGTILEGLRNFGGGGNLPQRPPPHVTPLVDVKGW